MSEKDAILEAEQSIQTMVAELQRMRDAADLLTSSQEQLAAVLSSAQEVLRATEAFSSQCGTVIDRLAATDLGSRLEDLQARHAQVEESVRDLKASLSTQIEGIAPSLDRAFKETSEQVSGVGTQAHADHEQISDSIRVQHESTDASFGKTHAQIDSLAEELRQSVKTLKTGQMRVLGIAGAALVMAVVILIGVLTSRPV